VALTVRGGRATALRTYVGGRWRPVSPGVTDWGTVPARAAAGFLLSLARSSDHTAGDKAIFAATLADSVAVWGDLLAIARDRSVPAATRKQAIFWTGQAAGEAATRGLDSLVRDPNLERPVQEQVVFALSQRPKDEGVPALIRVARTHRDPEIRKKALFWLGQSDDPRALALFEELLTHN
jgi:HEAT repeat protein